MLFSGSLALTLSAAIYYAIIAFLILPPPPATPTRLGNKIDRKVDLKSHNPNSVL